MQNTFKETIEKSKEAIKSVQDKIEDTTSELKEDTTETIEKVKSTFAKLSAKLKENFEDFESKSDEAKLQANLSMMEARDKLVSLRDDLDNFSSKIISHGQTAIDTTMLKAHLAKLESEDFWSENREKLTKEFENSKESVEKLALEASTEVKEFFDKFTTLFSKKA
ncbi:MAG: hypothetical protein FNT15_03765 [Sulfurovum sp.]|nr:MAG: hypothetical protein FNT15_03765 [Sulfurovum sp.]